MTYPLTTTLAALREAGACFDGYNKGIRSLQGEAFTEEDEGRESYIPFAHEGPILLGDILASNGFTDALWAMQTTANYERNCRLFAVWCARQTLQNTTDPRVVECCNVAERFANGAATEEELSAAWAAAWAARSAAWYAAESAARSATESATESAARSAARSAQKEMFIKMCNGTAPWQEVK